MPTRNVVAVITAIERAYLDSARDFSARFPRWKSSTDARITTFIKIANTINACKLTLIFATDQLTDPKWWSQYPFLLNSFDNHPNRSKELEIITRVAFVQFHFALVEASLRLFLRAVDPAAAANATAAFESVYIALLKRLTLTNREKASFLRLLNMWRNTRNAIHNNMVHFHASQKPTRCRYRNRYYFFRIGKPLPFVTWKLLLLMSADAGDMLKKLVATPELSVISRINDPAHFNLGKKIT